MGGIYTSSKPEEGVLLQKLSKYRNRNASLARKQKIGLKNNIFQTLGFGGMPTIFGVNLGLILFFGGGGKPWRNKAAKFAGKICRRIRWEICVQFSEILQDQIKNSTQSALQNLGIKRWKIYRSITVKGRCDYPEKSCVKILRGTTLSAASLRRALPQLLWLVSLSTSWKSSSLESCAMCRATSQLKRLSLRNGRNTVSRVLFRKSELAEFWKSRWVLRKTRWVCCRTQRTGWEELTEVFPQILVSAKKLTELGARNHTLWNHIRPISWRRW